MIKHLIFGLVLVPFLGLAQKKDNRHRVQELLNNTDSIAVNKELGILSKGANEDDLDVLVRFYAMRQNQAKVDSVKNIAITRFPKGAIAYNEAVGVFSRMKKYADKKAFSAEVFTNFAGNDLTYLYALLANEAAKNADCETLKNAYKQIEDKPIGINFIPRISESIMGSLTNDPCMNEILLDMKKNFNTHLAEQLIDEAAPSMQLKDLNGKEVSLSALRGKTVILDFWATWCSPCVESFPGMQQAVTYYSNDPDVVFLFINTSERGNDDRVESIKKFIEDRNLSFTVLLDHRDAETNKYTASKDFGITGLPTKIVIDKKGRIRLRLIGSNGATTFIKEEMQMIVDLVNKN